MPQFDPDNYDPKKIGSSKRQFDSFKESKPEQKHIVEEKLKWVTAELTANPHAADIPAPKADDDDFDKMLSKTPFNLIDLPKTFL